MQGILLFLFLDFEIKSAVPIKGTAHRECFEQTIHFCQRFSGYSPFSFIC